MCVIRNHPGTDTWPWDTAEQVEAAPDTMPAPESRAATSLTGATTATDAEVVDGRSGMLERMRREPRGPPAAGGRPFRLIDGDHDEPGHQDGPAVACTARG